MLWNMRKAFDYVGLKLCFSVMFSDVWCVFAFYEGINLGLSPGY